jgi:DNA-binding response OmpR family regulator
MLSPMSPPKNTPADDPVRSPVSCPPNPRQRILVVDDELQIRQVNTVALIYSGYHADAAEDGAVAWDALQRTNYDLLVTDYQMPKVTGLELIKKIHAARMEVPVILASGIMPEEELTRCPWLQPNLTLLKPYGFHQLLAAVKQVLRTFSEARNQTAPPPDWQPQVGQPQVGQLRR